MITGKSPTCIQVVDNGIVSHNERLVTWVREKRRKVSEVECWKEQIIYAALELDYDIIDIVKLETLAMVALDCVEEEKDSRPTMSQVVERLQYHEHGS
ncbi:unnamed protein product [Trifolium pratense]|uniref:Uncharacterized protein n=1 Tax=Trifolium pratense TaxID=57577 RepID=A0ACB0J887_TRIPR|nr:unnamed protein product [Trifolium pratense]